MVNSVPSTLEQWLAYQALLFPRAIDLGLSRLNLVLQRLQWRQPDVPVITIAGTNGKGSVVATCAAILTAAGYRVGTFTSPHLRDYRERIRIDGRNVEDAPLLAAFARIEAARGDTALTFFDYNTLAALLVFEAARLDAWVLEVGMGGRLDAVNVVDADVAVVVSIGFDHQEYLGDTLEAIGAEKAGIFRADRPAVLGGRNQPAILEQRARAIGARAKRLGAQFDYTREADSWTYRGTQWHLAHLPPPALRGAIQYENAATAIAAVEELAPRIAVAADAVARGLTSVSLVGRFQVIADPRGQAPTWILDVSHNIDAARVLAANLRTMPIAGKTFAICGILADKDAVAIVDELSESVDAWLFVSLPGERGCSAAALEARVAGHLRAPAAAYETVAQACEATLANALSPDRVVVFGSFHTVGPALDWLEGKGYLPGAPMGGSNEVH